MRSFQDTFKTRKRSFINAFSICMTVPLKNNGNRYRTYKYKALQCKIENLIEFLKQSYYKGVYGKLSSISTSSKYCWSLF